MSGNLPRPDNFLPLLNDACDGTLTEAQIRELVTVLDSDAATRKVFIDHISLQADIRFLGRAERLCDIGLAGVQAIVPQAASSSCPAPTPTLGFLSNAFQGTVGYFSSGWPVAYLLATVIFGLGLLIGSHVYVSEPEQVARQSALPSTFGRGAESMLPSPSGRGAGGEGSENVTHSRPTVGRITGMVDCKWEGKKGDSPPLCEAPEGPFRQRGTVPLFPLVSLGNRFALASGLMEITYDTGAKVILQGPVTYEVESNGGYLAIGKLTGKLEKKNDEARMTKDKGKHEIQMTSGEGLQNSSFVIRPSSFVIHTPTAIVTDLGTEFGVEVSKEGHTTSHVFRGLVRLQVASADGKAEGVTQVLHENESARVERSGGKQGDNRVVVFVPTSMPSNFVREISKRTIKVFDLVNVVAGGDGFSGRRNRGIDPTNGRIAATPNKEYKSESEYPVGDRRYHRVEGLSFVDGVFVPDGSRGPVQTDSAGHVFAEFRATSNQSPAYIWAGGAIPFNIPGASMTKLGDIDYASAGHGVLALHANMGVSFDLAAIRRANLGWKVLRFRATGGNAEPVSIKGQLVSADLLILVDGQERFKRREINGCNGAFPVLVHIHDNDRFLTLASTDGGNGVCWDWIAFGDPRLELAPAQTAGPKDLQPK